MVELTLNPIDSQTLLEQVASNQAGAVVLFLGVTREFTQGRRTESLEYQCYPAMAENQLAELEQEARRRWPIVHCAIVHRLGRLAVSETSVGIAISSAHRQAAFEACQWLMEAIKQVVPIWKKENWADGTSQWVHPGVFPERQGSTPAPGVVSPGRPSRGQTEADAR